MKELIRIFKRKSVLYAGLGILGGCLFAFLEFKYIFEPQSLLRIVWLAPFVFGFFASFVGIERDRVEEEVRARTVEFEKATHMAHEAVKTKANFLATMSHEIRTPMNAVLSCTGLLLDSVKDPEERKLLKTIENSGDALLTLINDILDYSKIESGKVDLENEPYSLQENVEEIISLFRPKAQEKKVSLEYRFEDGTPEWVLGDFTRFRQILTNLVGNAIKFTKTKVDVTITAVRSDGAASARGDDAPHRVGEGYTITIAVKDDGIGIPRNAQRRLFKSFSQVDASTTRKFGGTGLGLAICKGLVDAMGGEIWVESKTNEGSTFSFTLIANETDAGISTRKVTYSDVPRDMGTTHPLKILMAEDNRVNQLVARKVLAKLGYDVDIVDGGAEAVHAVLNSTYDVILMDQHMPDMDGLEATNLIVKQFKSKKRPVIIALTASAFKEDRDRCLAAGMDEFLTKPININSLVQALKAVPPNLSAVKTVAKAQGRSSALIGENVLSEQFAGETEFMAEVARQTLELIPVQMQEIQKCLSSGDAKGVQMAAHTLKGAVANFHSPRVVEAAKLIETAGKNSELVAAEKAYENLKTLMKSFVGELEGLSSAVKVQAG